MSSTAVDRLYRVLAQMFPGAAAELSDSSSPETVEGWDSLSHLNLVMALESEFAVAFTPEEALEMQTVGLIRTIISEHGVLSEPGVLSEDCVLNERSVEP